MKMADFVEFFEFFELKSELGRFCLAVSCTKVAPLEAPVISASPDVFSISAGLHFDGAIAIRSVESVGVTVGHLQRFCRPRRHAGGQFGRKTLVRPSF